MSTTLPAGVRQEVSQVMLRAFREFMEEPEVGLV